jgi:hypothetical protein
MVNGPSCSTIGLTATVLSHWIRQCSPRSTAVQVPTSSQCCVLQILRNGLQQVTEHVPNRRHPINVFHYRSHNHIDRTDLNCDPFERRTDPSVGFPKTRNVVSNSLLHQTSLIRIGWLSFTCTAAPTVTRHPGNSVFVLCQPAITMPFHPPEWVSQPCRTATLEVWVLLGLGVPAAAAAHSAVATAVVGFV